MTTHTRTISANPAGTDLARYIIAITQARGNKTVAASISEQWPDSPAVTLILRAAVSAMGTSTSALMQHYGLAQQYLAIERGAAVVGMVSPYARHVPFRTRVSREVTGAQSTWVGEGNPKPMSAEVLDSLTIEAYKNVTMLCLTDELLRFATPSVEQTIRQALAAAIGASLDTSFLDPTIGMIPQSRPASITNGATAVTSTGSTAAQITTDLTAMLAALASWGYPVWILKPSTAAALAGKTNTSGNLQFPNVTVTGGSLMGLPIVVSLNSPQQITLLDASDVILADGEVDISFAPEASVLMDSDPASSPMTTALVSLWQRDMIGILAERTIAWIRGHDTSVVYMTTSY